MDSHQSSNARIQGLIQELELAGSTFRRQSKQQQTDGEKKEGWISKSQLVPRFRFCQIIKTRT